LDWIEGRKYYDKGGESLKQVVQRSWTMPHHWKCSKSGWTGLWPTWSRQRCPRLRQAGSTSWSL